VSESAANCTTRYRVSAAAIRKLLCRNRIGPAPLRSRQTWKAFLRAQGSAIVLTDFLSVDTVFLKRLYVLLYMELATRAGDLVRGNRPPRRCLGNSASLVCRRDSSVGAQA